MADRVIREETPREREVIREERPRNPVWTVLGILLILLVLWLLLGRG